jgi:hypothetical protein
MTTYFVVFGGIALIVWTWILFDRLAYRREQKNHKK